MGAGRGGEREGGNGEKGERVNGGDEEGGEGSECEDNEGTEPSEGRGGFYQPTSTTKINILIE